MKNKGNYAITRKCFVGMESLIIAVLIGTQIKNIWLVIAVFFALLCIFYIPIVGGVLSFLCSVFETIIVCNIAMQYFSAPAVGGITFCVFCFIVILHRNFGVIRDRGVFGISLLIAEFLIVSYFVWEWVKSVPIALVSFAVLLMIMVIPVLRVIEMAALTIGISCVVFVTAQNYMDLKYAVIIAILVLVYMGYNHWLAYFGINYGGTIETDDENKKTEQEKPSKDEKYYEQTYYQITHNSYFDMLHDNGKYGEYMIYEKLRDFEKLGGKFLFNCYLDRKNHKTTEIDVLLICKSGIFVFESKNYNGWIYGKGWEKNWTQLLPLGKGMSEKVQFYNPLKQNETHINCLKSYVGSNLPIFSIVVFSDKCTLKNVNARGSNGHVIQLKQIVSTVNQCIEQTGIVLNETEILDLYHKLYPYSQVSQEVKEKHIQDIQGYKSLLNVNENKNKSVQMLVCPRCGSPMVLRTIKRGKDIGGVFYGCSAFPDCRYTREVPERQKTSDEIQ